MEAHGGRRARRRADDDGGEGEQVVGLNDHREAATVLSVLASARKDDRVVSPRTTEVLHQRSDFADFAPVRLIVHEAADLRREAGPPAFSVGGLGDRSAYRLGSADPPAAGYLVERTKAVRAEP